MHLTFCSESEDGRIEHIDPSNRLVSGLKTNYTSTSSSQGDVPSQIVCGSFESKEIQTIVRLFTFPILLHTSEDIDSAVLGRVPLIILSLAGDCGKHSF